MSFTLENGKEIKSISTKNTDYFQWGTNCKNLNFSTEQVSKILESYIDNMTQEEIDDFYNGYSN